MSIYKTIATCVATVAAVAALYGQPQKIDGYRVSSDIISTGDFPSATVWEDTNGDGVFDKKTHSVLAGRRGVITIDKPFEESDRRLTDGLVVRLK